MAIIVNFMGGPGCAKSTMAAHVFAELKWKSVNCELVTEYAKDRVWDESFFVLENQIYVFGKQHHRIYRASKHVDVILTDSPIVLSIIYNKNFSEKLNELVLEEFNKYDNINYFLTRKKPYNPVGRTQNLEEAIKKDSEVYNMIEEYKIDAKRIDGERSSVALVVEDVMSRLKNI